MHADTTDKIRLIICCLLVLSSKMQHYVAHDSPFECEITNKNAHEQILILIFHYFPHEVSSRGVGRTYM